jgi:transcriptional regulator with XRE-family HTH domain
MTPRQRFGRFLASARKRAGLSQRDISTAIGIPSGAQFVSNWENGKSLPPASYLPHLLKLLAIKKVELKAKLSALVSAEANERYERMVRHLEGR